MEFQFGTNWSYYSHYVGDIFGAPLAIEGLMAFFLESTFVGLFFFGWDRLGKGHMLDFAQTVPAEEEQTYKGGYEEEGHQTFNGQRRTEDIPYIAGII